MILTCPECATGYFVQDGQIRPEGRTVRCAACGTRWTAYPEGGLELTPADEAPRADAETAADDADDLSLTAEELPKAFRDRAEEDRKLRKAAVSGVGWGGAVVALVAIIGLALIFRDGVVRAWPQTASLYATIGLPVNPTGLVFEQIRFEPGLHGGHPTIDVSGVIRNIAGRPETAPPLRISLFNAQGKRVAGEVARLDNAHIPAGEARFFTTSIMDPPYSATNMVVEFALGAGPHAATTRATSFAAPSAATAPSFTLRGQAGSASPTDAVNLALPPAANVATP